MRSRKGKTWGKCNPLRNIENIENKNTVKNNIIIVNLAINKIFSCGIFLFFYFSRRITKILNSVVFYVLDNFIAVNFIKITK